MPVTMTIDLSELKDLEREMKELSGAGRKILDLVSQDVYHQWFELADSGLRSGRKAYLDNLEEPTFTDEHTVQIKLSGWLPVAIEAGVPSFDMKAGLLASPKAKYSTRTGRKYIRVPLSPYGEAVKNSFQATIRTVTSNSKGWIHPGIEARDYRTKAVDNIDEVIDKAVDQVIEEALGNI